MYSKLNVPMWKYGMLDKENKENRRTIDLHICEVLKVYLLILTASLYFTYSNSIFDDIYRLSKLNFVSQVDPPLAPPKSSVWLVCGRDWRPGSSWSVRSPPFNGSYTTPSRSSCVSHVLLLPKCPPLWRRNWLPNRSRSSSTISNSTRSKSVWYKSARSNATISIQSSPLVLSSRLCISIMRSRESHGL